MTTSRTFKNHMECGMVLRCAKLSQVLQDRRRLWALPTDWQQRLQSFLKPLVQANHINSTHLILPMIDTSIQA